eukprot:9496767-Pyramimonas_sp.AAC.1
MDFMKFSRSARDGCGNSSFMGSSVAAVAGGLSIAPGSAPPPWPRSSEFSSVQSSAGESLTSSRARSK